MKTTTLDAAQKRFLWLRTSLLLVATAMQVNVFAQAPIDPEETSWWCNAANTHCGYMKPEKYIYKTSVPSVNNQVLTWTNAGWTMVSAFSDEFNSGVLDQSKWMTDYGWGNNYTGVFAWNNTNPSGSGKNHIFTNSGGNNVLRLENRQEYVEKKAIDYLPHDQMLQSTTQNGVDETRPNLRPEYYTTAMINSRYKPATPYGYFEIRCKLPASRFVIADFWLWSAETVPGAYDEIDIFELEGRNWYATSHNQKDTQGKFYSHTQNIVSSDFKFQDEFNTFGMKWEPNRISFYLNNVLVRTINDHIPVNPMAIIANFGVQTSMGYAEPENSPAYFDIDYIRMYQRTSPYIDFAINGDQNSSTTQVYDGQKILLDGNLPLCYNPNSNTNGIYFLSFQQCDAAGNPIGNEAAKWLTMLESQKLHELDAKALATSAGMNLTAGNYYRVKMATSNPWTEKVRIIYINPCVNAPDFTINGISRTDLTPINVSYNGALPTLMLNIDKSTSCSGYYDLFIKPCDAAGNPIGWSSNEISLGQINTNLNNHVLKNLELQYFLHTFYSYALQPNQHYLIRLSTYDMDINFNPINIVSKTIVVYMPSCNEVLDFKVNDESRTDFTPIAILPNDSIYVSLYPAITCGSEYFFSIEPCTATGDGSANGSADEVSDYQFLLFQDKFKRVEPLSLVKFCKKNGVQLIPGNYYRLKLSNPITGGMKVVIIYIRQPYCVPPSTGSGCFIDRFEFKGFAFQSGFNGGYKDYSDHGLSDFANFTPQVYSGSTMPIQIYPRGRTNNPVMRYCRIWIDGNDDGVFQTTEQVYQTSGTGNFLNQSFVIPYYTTIGKKRMRVAVSLIGYPTPCGNGNAAETEDYSINVLSPLNPRFAAIDSTIQPTGLVCYPNPSNGNFSIQYTLDVQKNVSINLYDSQGRLVRELANEAAKTEGVYTVMLTNLNLAAGTYLVVMQAGDEVKTQKIIIQ